MSSGPVCTDTGALWHREALRPSSSAEQGGPVSHAQLRRGRRPFPLPCEGKETAFPLSNALPPPDQASPEMPWLASSGATSACPQLPRSPAGGPHREAEGLCATCPRKLVTPLFQGPAKATTWHLVILFL